MKILLIEEEINTLDVSAYALRREGYIVLTSTTATRGLSLLRSAQPHVVVASVKLPDMSGFEFCQRVRRNSAVPVILLTERTDDEHVVHAYQMGADDVVVKPFSIRQLTMRVRAVWRTPETPGDPEPQRTVQAGSITLDTEAYEVRRGDSAIHLTPIEFRLLYLLATNAERVVSSARLLEYAWKHDDADALLLRTHICRIRSKLRLPRGLAGDIFSMPGVGYWLSVDGPQSVIHEIHAKSLRAITPPLAVAPIAS